MVIDLTALVVNGKQADWHVRGADFIGVHELLDTIVAHAQNWTDLAAELDELDQTSQDVAIEIARGLDKDRWFLFAHISE